MKVKKLLLSFFVLALSVLLLAGCSKHLDPNGGFNAGETLNSDELEDLSNQIFTSGTTAAPIDNIFYWTESGSKVHLFSDCGHLKNSSGLRFGDEISVRSLKKDGMCSLCLKKAGKTEADFDFFEDSTTAANTGGGAQATAATTPTQTATEAPEPSYSVDYYTQFYWTESGSKYHLYRECGHIKNSASVLSGNKYKLAEAEKDGPCSSCLKKAGLTQDDFLAMLK